MTKTSEILSELRAVIDNSRLGTNATHEWMAPPKAAEYADSSTSTLAKLRLKGGGPRFCRIGRAIRYRRSDLDEWLTASSRRSTSDRGASADEGTKQKPRCSPRRAHGA
jgi:predicted DNA-binding transcriptional regulator AlpA